MGMFPEIFEGNNFSNLRKIELDFSKSISKKEVKYFDVAKDIVLV